MYGGGSCCVVQCVKDPVLVQLWHRIQLRLRCDTWPRNFHMLCMQPQKKKKKKRKKKEKGCRGKVERSSFAAQQVKDSVFLWLQLWLLLWHGFDPQPGISTCCGQDRKGRKKEKRKNRKACFVAETFVLNKQFRHSCCGSVG